jgi:hypothetical protein
MKKNLFLFVTPDGVTYSSSKFIDPDVENFQVLGYGEGFNEDDAFEDFLSKNQWILKTEFEEAICIGIKQKIYEGKSFCLKK